MRSITREIFSYIKNYNDKFYLLPISSSLVGVYTGNYISQFDSINYNGISIKSIKSLGITMFGGFVGFYGYQVILPGCVLICLVDNFYYKNKES